MILKFTIKCDRIPYGDDMNEAFEKARDKVVYSMKEYAGFGTYGEKSIHAVLKRYIEPDTDFHEVGVMGSIADICRDGKIYEIQTRALYKLKAKLKKFLPLFKVCIVYPVIAEKTIYKADPVSLKVYGKRKSPKKSSACDLLWQIYGLRDFLGDKNLSFRIIVLKVSEYQSVSDGKSRKKNIKFDTVPDEIIREISIEKPLDFKKLIPQGLERAFGSKDFAKCANMRLNNAQTALNVLSRCSIVEKIDKKGNAFIYRIIE